VIQSGQSNTGHVLADLTEEQRARLRQVLDGMLREGARGAVLTDAPDVE
jgi:hypothetical protein